MYLELFELVGLLVLGSLIGSAYFGELYLTIKRLPDSRRPEILVLVSFLVRIGVTGFIFYLLIADGEWQRLPIALIGFILARIVITRWLGTPQPRTDSAG